jgi:hypothetical protein
VIIFPKNLSKLLVTLVENLQKFPNLGKVFFQTTKFVIRKIKTLHTSISVLFLGEIRPLSHQKEVTPNPTRKVFFGGRGGKWAKSRHISRGKS